MPSSALHIITRKIAGFVRFSPLASFIHPELLSALIFSFAFISLPFYQWEDPEMFVMIMCIEFLMFHANIGIAVAGNFSPKKVRGLLMALMIAFYFIFVLAFTLGTGAWWISIVFIQLTWYRIQQSRSLSTNNPEIFSDILVGMLRFGVLMFSAMLYGIMMFALDIPEDYFGLGWGTFHFWGLYLLKKPFSSIQKSATLKMNEVADKINTKADS